MNQVGGADLARVAKIDVAPRPGPALRAALLVALGCLALALGVLVYLADRDPSRALLIPAVAAFAGGQWFGAIGRWLPSFVHPFAFGLFTAAALPARSVWCYGACAAWGAVNVAFEFGQHRQVSTKLAAALQGAIGDTPCTRALANYFVRGTFDGGDIAAAMLGALAAAAALRLLQIVGENRHAL